MSAEADALAEMARNRGLKLVRSRVRTPTRRGYGKYGLTDAKGAALLGLDGKVPSATAEEVEQYLRKGLVSDWAGSLGVDPPQARRPRVAVRKPAPPPPPPKPKSRAAAAGDGAAIAALAALAGHEVDAAGVAARLKAIKAPQLVATLGGEVVGLCALGLEVDLLREAPLGRIGAIVVAEAARGQGIGRLLVEEAAARLKRLGCDRVEIVARDGTATASRFCASLGFEPGGGRFVKQL